MKNSLFAKKAGVSLLVILLSAAFLFYACHKNQSSKLLLSEKAQPELSKSSNLPPSQEDRSRKKLFLNDFMYLGEKHNEGLDFILKEMISERKKVHRLTNSAISHSYQMLF